ncbi:MAG: dipeptidase PepV [Clostridiaceae bacterium]|nr:dipeptidase PepV [Clostridiaceae bacterium]
MQLNNKIDELREQLINSTQEILRIKSVEDSAIPGMPFGEGVGKALETALNIAKNLGFKTVNLDGYIGYAEVGEGEDYIGVLGHLDVVPEGEGWIYPPYAAEIHDGKIYGRGTLDDKGPIMASLYGLKAVVDCGLTLSKKVRVIFGTNEETGSGEIEHYLKTERPPILGFTPDAEYPMIFAEKGITIFNIVKDLEAKSSTDIIIKAIKGGLKANMVPEYCEAIIETKNREAIISDVLVFAERTGYNVTTEVRDNLVVIKSSGVAAHGSLPHLGKNAIMQLFAFLENLELGKSDIADFISFFNRNVGMEVHGESFGIGLQDEESGKLSFNAGVIDMNEEKVTFILNIRYPVTNTFEDMMKPFNAKIKGTGMRVEEMIHQAPLYFPKEHPLIKILQKVYVEQTHLDSTPIAIGGGTYAKEMPNIVAFGPIFPGKPDLDHQVNEYIEVEDLIMNAKIYAHAIYELAK